MSRGELAGDVERSGRDAERLAACDWGDDSEGSEGSACLRGYVFDDIGVK